MTCEELSRKALEECCSAETTAHHGGGEGRPYWNVHSSQFMFAPSFQFPSIPHIKRYRFTATDENGGEHTFEATSSCALLAPIWREIAEGVVRLRVTALDRDGEEVTEVGTRTFFKLAPFPSDLPQAACTYRECAVRAFEYTLSQPSVRHWLESGTPDPDYDLNVYPSKMISAIIAGMLEYACISPEKEAEAVQLAKNAADYLLKITYDEKSPLAGLPPTYYVDFRPNPETRQNLTADRLKDTVMLIYPAHVGKAYLQLWQKTDERKYLDGALKIAQYYREHIQANGSWYLVVSAQTGEAVDPNYCNPLERIVPFLMALYERTGEAEWKELSDRAIAYVEREILPAYNWEAQFEDSPLSVQYSNLTHYGACALIRYYAQYFADDAEKMACAEDLMRFVEDQFVIWKRPPVWNGRWTHLDEWRLPAGLEQYEWYVPIDASTADIMLTFLAMYRAGRGELYLAKAKALADQITRMQQANGQIPTHWFSDEWTAKSLNFWLNCHFQAASAMAEMAKKAK